MTKQDYKIIAKCISDAFKDITIGNNQIDFTDAVKVYDSMLNVFTNAFKSRDKNFDATKFQDYIAKFNRE